MSDTHGKFVWYELMTTDTAAAAQFYGSVVGWTARDAGMDDNSYQLFEIPGTERGVGGLMTLPEELKTMGVPPHWVGYVAVDDVDAMAKTFTDNGGAVRRPPSDIPGIGRFAVVADPQGAVLIIFKPIPMDNPPPEPTMTPGYCGWHELYAVDGATAFDFYAKVFGWTKDMAMDMGAMGIYQTFAQNGVMMGGMMTKPADMPVPAWGYYFIVEGVDTAIDKIKSGGGQILEGPMEVPGSFVVQATDAQGAYFAVTGPRG
ncbi:MAG: Glyoxalase/bleomycin resistance protein/dioxygenase [Rhizobium sp.]|nr:Glyoxalase/bleomycin resistance protein/dioxygenase [Rhizobium sp.]